MLGVNSVSDRLAVGDPRVLPARYQATQTFSGIPGSGMPMGSGAPMMGGGFTGAPSMVGNTGFVGGGAPAMGYDANAPLPEGPAISRLILKGRMHSSPPSRRVPSRRWCRRSLPSHSARSSAKLDQL